MRGNRRNAARRGDQADWEGCLAWRRMVVGLLNARLDVSPVMAALVDYVRGRAAVLEGVEGMGPYIDTAQTARLPNGIGPSPYSTFYNVLEVLVEVERARCVELPESVVLDDEIALVGHVLCRIIRGIYPKTPDGFERVGRMRNGADRRAPE